MLLKDLMTSFCGQIHEVVQVLVHALLVMRVNTVSKVLHPCETKKRCEARFVFAFFCFSFFLVCFFENTHFFFRNRGFCSSIF